MAKKDLGHPQYLETIEVFFIIERHTKLMKEALGECFATDVLDLTINSIKESLINNLAAGAYIKETFKLLEKAKNTKQAKYIFAYMLSKKEGSTLYKALKQIIELSDEDENSFESEWNYCQKFLRRRKFIK